MVLCGIVVVCDIVVLCDEKWEVAEKWPKSGEKWRKVAKSGKSG